MSFASNSEDTLPEMRKDPFSDRWVIMAPRREGRPDDFNSGDALTETESEFDPFIEGSEHLTPIELYASRKEGLPENGPGWNVRVVPNGYPALAAEYEFLNSSTIPTKTAIEQTLYQSYPGMGAHEVIIECPQYEEEIARLPESQFEEILNAYKARIQDLKANTMTKQIIIFKNKGQAAGASLGHAHSQLLALPNVPQGIDQELNHCTQFKEKFEKDLFDTFLKSEIADKKRIVLETDQFVVLSAYAGRFAYETWIVPKNREPHFEDASIESIRECAKLLKDVLNRFNKILDRPDYNFILHTAPFRDERADNYRWHFELFPRSTGVAGFEWGTSCFVNAVYPEIAAKELRAAGEN